jgi:8-oxo-dGTP pyrophosphatase MutT (NUDIX family)
MSRVLPPPVAAHARAVAAGTVSAASLQQAATVLLVREGVGASRGVEVYVQRRHAGLAFAAGMLAFPGGRVDPGDREASVTWHGPGPAAFAGWFGTDEGEARGFLVAAVREVLEEAGVLLAGALADPASHGGPPLAQLRALASDDPVGFGAALADAGLALRTDLFVPWARWVTPRFERRRYDTWFLACALPAGVEVGVASGESDAAGWARPEDVLADHEAGRLAMLPPTQAAVRALLGVDAPAGLAAAGPLADAPVVPRIAPGVRDRDGDIVLVLPGEDGYPGLDPAEGT